MSDHHAGPFNGAAQPSTLIELLRLRARSRPDEEVYTFWPDEGAETVSLTYGEVDRQARAIGAWLRSRGAANDRALLLYPPGLEFVAAFFGCLYAGVVPVPAYPPRLNRNLLRVRAIIADAQARFALTTAPILARIEKITEHVSDSGGLCWLDTGKVPEGIEEAWRPPRAGGESLAFLQYTSGSTGAPKGAMLSHANLLHNASLIYRTLFHAPGDKYVSWLPTFHDMGFMAGVLQPLYGGLPVTLISPTSFLRSPIRWLQAITGAKATTSGGPNFAYDLCVRKTTPEQRAALDLSSWTTAFNGAEPIRAETLERFIKTFEPCGFRPEAMYPCYGLAEATLIVSGGRKSDPPVVKRVRAGALEAHRVVEAGDADDDARDIVGCGSPLLDQRVVIVNPETMSLCPAGEVGEIWVAGPSVAQGYWRLAEESARTFQARLADTGEGPFLRTGDLGFLHEGELFVTGRLKDLIIIRGANHYPQDIELTIERSHPALRPGCGAAFSIDLDGEERLVAVQEVEKKAASSLPAVVETIRQAVAEAHDLHVHSVVLIKPGSIPKTSSGKIQRRACRAAFLEGSLEALEGGARGAATAAAHAHGLTREALSAAPPDGRRALLERYLREQVASALRVEPSEIKPESPVNTLGLDSLTSIGLQGCVETDLGVSVSMVSFLQEASLSALAEEILRLFEGQPAAPAPSPAPRVAASEYALSHGQRALWYLHHLAPESAAYNISRAVRIRTPLDVAALRRALQKLLDRHASLRATFHERRGEALQHVHESAELFMREEDAASWGEDELQGRLVEEANRPFDLERGPLFRAHLFSRAGGEHVLLLSVHHIVADFWSLAVLMHELGALYQAGEGGGAQELSPPSLDYADYVRWQDEMLSGPDGERRRDYWRTQLAGELPPLELPLDHPRPPVQTYRGSSESLRLDAELTRRLKELGGARGSTLYVVLLAAFQVLLHRYTGQKSLTVGSPAAGRGHAGFSEVVGYFVNPLVLRADLTGDPTFEEFLGQVGRRVLGALEHQDYPFPLLVEQLQPARDPSRTPLFQAMFVLQKTHLTGDNLAAFALGEAGARMELGALTLESVELKQRVAQFDLTLMAAEVEGGLAATLEYNSDLFEAATIRRMLAHYRNLLEAVAAEPRRTVAELPLLDEEQREALIQAGRGEAADFPLHLPLHRLFESQARRSPDAPALRFAGAELSYAELDSRASALASRLLALGLPPEPLVGVCLPRSPEL
ncbi:MAG TPA: condensation domain-containing protein, partial [Pyrinomonadaceae bacterium]